MPVSDQVADLKVAAVEPVEELGPRVLELLTQHKNKIYTQTSRLFTILMLVQWVATAGIAAAVWISRALGPGRSAEIHLHVAGDVSGWDDHQSAPVFLTIAATRTPLRGTRWACARCLMSGLLIHLTGGRIETHFHVFGSLAFLAFYRDWLVLVPATIVVALDHALRGIYYPQSVFGIVTASPWRWVEHAAWVVFEDVILIKMCLQGVQEMWEIAKRQASIEAITRGLEGKVLRRTAELERAKEAAEAASRAKSEFLAEHEP